MGWPAPSTGREPRSSSCWPQSVRVPLAELAIANGLFPGLAGVVKTLAGELGPAGIRINGLLPVRIATKRVQ